MRSCIVCSGDIPVKKRSDALYCSEPCGQNFRYKRYYRNHPDKLREKRRSDNAKAESRMYSRAKCRAKKAGIPFDIDVSDVVIPECCPVLGIKLHYLAGRGSGFKHDSASIDKIVPKLGYTKGNIRVISARANLLKNDATIDELYLVLEDLRKLYNV